MFGLHHHHRQRNLAFSVKAAKNLLTETVNGSPAQSFTYDGHDKLTGGTAGGETDGYDPNGNETSVSIYGSVYRDTYDDEDRLTSVTLPSGIVDTFTYNGLGLRVGKTDSTGTYAYVCDGTSPGAPVLSDGHALYNPGLSESRAGTLSFYDFDQLGSLWTLDAGTGDSTPGGGLYTAFGTPILTSNLATPFRYGGASGCQTDADTGLVLMGHRYYDSRIGRFLTQDPAGDGGNWYAYAGNDPVDNTDPSGLDDIPTDLQQFTSGQPTGYDSNGNPQWTSADGMTTVTTYLPQSIGDGQEHPSGGFQGLLGFFDNNLTFGTGAGLNRAIGAFQSGHGSGLAVAGAGLLFAGAVAVNFVPGEEEANAAVHGAEGLEALTALWHEGGEADAAINLAKHYGKHADDVNADSLLQYARKAAAHFQNAKKGATKQAIEGATEGVIRYRKAGRAMDLAPDGRIISFF